MTFRWPSLRVRLLIAATLLFFGNFGFHVGTHYLKSLKSSRIVVADFTHPHVRAVTSLPDALYTGQTYEVKILIDSLDMSISESLDKRFDYGMSHPKCKIEAPDYAVVATPYDCDFFVSPKVAGNPLLIITFKNEKGPNKTDAKFIQTIPKVTRGSFNDDSPQAKPIILPVQAPLEASIPAVSTFLGIMTAIASLFFKQSGTDAVDDSATQRLLNKIAKKRRNE